MAHSDESISCPPLCAIGSKRTFAQIDELLRARNLGPIVAAG
jgi:hypothetical protein